MMVTAFREDPQNCSRLQSLNGRLEGALVSRGKVFDPVFCSVDWHHVHPEKKEPSEAAPKNVRACKKVKLSTQDYAAADRVDETVLMIGIQKGGTLLWEMLSPFYCLDLEEQFDGPPCPRSDQCIKQRPPMNGQLEVWEFLDAGQNRISR